jgi:branched-subunit amino acid aminotransferase/4-amino-4-deoxychorismate lyase
VRHGARVAARLVRDAAQLGLGALDAALCLAALEDAARAELGAAQGVVRLEARRGAGGAAELVPGVRALGPDPALWSAVVAPGPHEGPGPFQGAKRSGWPCVERARAAAAAAGVDEALLFDAAGYLVEGGRSSLVVVRADGSAVAPPLARGRVRSVALEIALEARALAEGDVTLEELRRARELVALNAVRGARPIVRLDGRPVGAGAAGPLARTLETVLDAAG